MEALRRAGSTRAALAAAALALPCVAASQGAPRAGAPPPATPGGAEAEREAAERALERALVQKGALLLSPGRIEIVPEISFAYGDGAAPLRVTPPGTGSGARSEVLTGSLTLRIGLPLDLQAEATAPFVVARITPGGTEPDSAPARGSGLGDVAVALSWHAIRGRARFPDVLLGGFWKSRSGRTIFDDPEVRVPLGKGVEQFGGTLAIVKAVDPLVLLATGTYAVSAPRWIPQGWLEAGDEFGGSAGAVLAVSPGASLSFALEALHARPFRLERVTVYRSDRTSAVFRVGIAAAVSRRSFFQTSVGMGLTSDVPRFEVSIAMPLQL